MFSAAREKIAKITNVDLNAAFMKAITDPSVEAQLIDLNQKQLYEQGILADGTPTGEYANFTKQKKDALGVESGHITLKDTGAFYDSMKVVEQGEGVVISGDTDKENNDLALSWPGLLGITEESRKELQPEILQLMQTEIKSQL